MLTHVKKTNVLALALGLPLIVLGTQRASAQSAPGTPPTLANGPGAPATQPTQPAQPSANPANGDTAANTSATGLDYFYNHQGQDGTAAKGSSDILSAINDKIRSSDILGTPALDNAVIGEQFKTYLGLPAVTDDRIQSYFGQMQQVSDLLKSGQTFGAWKVLYSMSDYTDLDAGISRELAHRIEAIWNSGRTQNNLEIANTKLRSNLDTDIHNADQTADDLHQQALEENSKPGRQGGGGSGIAQNNSSITNSALSLPNADPIAAEASMLPQMGAALQQKMELTDEYLQSLEARANIKINEIKEHKMDADDQADFAQYIKLLYDSHRYYHVIIAADFYRAIFNQGDYPVDMQSEVNQSLETNQQVNQSIQVFKYDASKGEISGASTELQTAFIANEFNPGLQGLPRDQKEKVGDYLTDLDVLKNEIEVRDFGQIDAQLAKIQTLASDFDSTKPQALVDSIKLESRMRLGQAKLLAQQGQLNDAMKAFETAANIWPGNPDLTTASASFFGHEDVSNQATTDFDRLVNEGNDREIFANAVAFAPAVHGDTKREQELKDAVAKVQKAEIASEKANMMVMSGDVDGAWEVIEEATKDWPDDVKLNQQLASLSARGSDFVSAIDKARDAESKKEYGYSLTWYVNALNIYPASTIAHDGVDNVSKLILSTPEDKTASAQD
jgi:tetratricopeptide (TPR) repeat protein